MQSCSIPQRCIFGIYPIIRPQIPQKTFTLQSLVYDVQIFDSIAKTCTTLTYFNESSVDIEGVFRLPIQSNVCIDSLTIQIGDTVIRGLIKDKKQAKQEYNENLRKGNTVAYGERDQDLQDIMNINLGNIHPNQIIEVRLTFIEQLEISAALAWKYVIPATLTPRYALNQQQQQQQQQGNSGITTQSDMNYTWNINIKINSSSKITYLQSTSHDIEYEFSQENHEVIIKFAEVNKPNKNFVLYYLSENTFKPQLALERTPQGQYCGIFNYIPFQNQNPITGAIQAGITDPEAQLEVDMSTAKGEFIFLIDRSGSMEDLRIKKAKEALKIFLKSLPEDSYFDICSFGGSFNFLSKTGVSQRYSQATVDKAINTVKTFGADMGGTEILEPLEKILNKPLVNNYYPRSIFILTDGDVSNTKHLLERVQQICGNTTRIFSLGIGNGASDYLVKQLAYIGKGKSEMISDDSSVSAAVINLLTCALEPCIKNFQLTYNSDLIDGLSPNPATLSHVLKNEPFTTFIFFSDKFQTHKITQLDYSFQDSLGNTENATLICNIENSMPGNSFFKLGSHLILKQLEQQLTNLKNYHSDCLYKPIQKPLENDIIKFSVERQVLSTKTAFICVVENKHQATFGQSVKEIIPNYVSSDYQIQDDDENVFATHTIQRKNTSHPMQSAKSKCSPSIFQQFTQGIKNTFFSSSSPPRAQPESCQQSNIVFDDFNDMQMDQCRAQLDLLEDEEEAECEEEQQNQKKYSEKIDRFSDSRQSDVIPDIQNNTEIQLNQIISQQQISGNWVWSYNLLKQINLDPKTVETQIPSELNNKSNKLDIWITVIVIAWFEGKQATRKDVWQLVHIKAKSWINKQNVNLDTLINSANLILNWA